MHTVPIAACNFAGHSGRLLTLVDASIAWESPPGQLLCASAGDAHAHMVLSVQQLMAATSAQAGSFSSHTPPAARQQQLQQQMHQQQPPSELAAPQQLTQPWSEGAERVQLVGVLAQRRR